MPDQTLLLLLSDVRDKTLRLLDGVSDTDARWAPPGTANHILWHAGHAYVVVQALSARAFGSAAPSYPDGWFDKFSWQSKPATVTAWPTLAEVMQKLREQKAELAKVIAALTEPQLDTQVGTAERPRTLRHAIMHGLHDEANHQGEIYLLKKLLARGTQ